MIVYLLIRPRGWDNYVKPYKENIISVKKNSLRYFMNIILEKLKGNDVQLLEYEINVFR